jgi:hypothetical protein
LVNLEENDTKTMPSKASAARKKSSIGKQLNENKWLVALGVALALAAAFAFFNTAREPLPADISEFHNGQPQQNAKAVRFIMVYSSECPKCEVNSSFVLLLKKNNIEFAAQKYEAGTEDGKRFIEELGLKKLPVILVDGKSLSESMIVKSDEVLSIGTPSGAMALKSFLLLLAKKHPAEVRYNSNADIFIMPELALDGKRHIDFLLGEECAPENPQHLARVDIFVDPYSTPYIKSTEAMDFYRDYYKGRMQFNYHYLPIEASKKFPEATPWGNIETLARYIVCADKQGFIQEAEHAFYARYCAIDDDNVLQPIERSNCRDSNHFGFPILGSEAELIATIDLNYDESEFAECLSALPEQFAADAALAEQLEVHRVPTVVINCKYSTHALNIDKGLCKLNPEMEHCPFYG